MFNYIQESYIYKSYLLALLLEIEVCRTLCLSDIEFFFFKASSLEQGYEEE